MTDIPEEYVLQKFYEHAGYPKFKKINNVHEAGCPMCFEGRSWGKKRRLYYIPKEEVICCHNCGWYGSPVKWIQQVSRMSYEEIEYELETGEYRYIDVSKSKITPQTTPIAVDDLPRDSINMYDTDQLNYYRNNKVVKECLNLIATRRLDTAINRPSALYLSLKDSVHKNRLCIPFYNRTGEVVHYQTRGFLSKDLENRPKYLSKLNSQKTLFNIDNVSQNADNIYIFEGPIDAFFVKDSVALAGIQENSDNVYTDAQKQMMSSISLANKIWVLDNQWRDQASYKKTKMLIDRGEHVFIWPKELIDYKDFNDMIMKFALDEIDQNFILKSVSSGLSARMKFSRVRSCQL